MENTPENLEAVLRSAPAPRPPASLKETLLSEVRKSGALEGDAVHARSRGGLAVEGAGSRWRRWWPAWLPVGLAAAAASVLLVQQDHLREALAQLGDTEAASAGFRDLGAQDEGATREVVPIPDERSEIARLRALVEKLSAEVASGAKIEAENVELKAAIAAARAAAPEDVQAMVDVSEKAKAIECVNNLKLLGLAARVYAVDNSDEFPPTILSMTNELGSPKILVCPADDGRAVAANWATYSAANLSYEFLSPGPAKHQFEPQRVLFRCPVHGHVGLCDGSVQMGVLKTHPEWFSSRDGGLYMDKVPPVSPPPPGAEGAGGDGAGGSIPIRRLTSVKVTGGGRGGAAELLAARYGLVVAPSAEGSGDTLLLVPPGTNGVAGPDDGGAGAGAGIGPSAEAPVEVPVDGASAPQPQPEPQP